MFDLVGQVWGLIRSKTARDASVVFGGNAVSSFLAIIFTILAARFLGPESWGIVAAVISFISITVAIGELGFDAGLINFVSQKWSANKKKEAQKIINVVFSLRFFLALVIAVGLIIFAKPLTPLIFKADNSLVLVLAALGFFGALLLDFQIAATEAKQDWKKAALFIALTNFFRLSLLLLLRIIGKPNLIGVLAIFVGGSLIAFLVSLLGQKAKVSFQGTKLILKKIIPFSGWMGANKIISVVNSRVDVLLLVQLASTFETGIYAAANRLAMGVPILVSSFATVLAPRFASFGEIHEVKKYLKKAIGLSVIIIAGLLVGILVAPWVIALFGTQYHGSTPVLQALFVTFIPFILSTPGVDALIYAFKKPQVLTITGAVQLPFILLVNFFLIPVLGIYAPVVVYGMVNLSTLLVVYTFVFLNLKEK